MSQVKKNSIYSNSSYNVTAWDVTWNNATRVTIEGAFWMPVKGEADQWFATFKETAMAFPTTSDATNYLNSYYKSGYDLTSTTYNEKGFYYNTTGHNPSVYKFYENGPTQDIISKIRTYESITQTDNYLYFLEMKVRPHNQ